MLVKKIDAKNGCMVLRDLPGYLVEEGKIGLGRYLKQRMVDGKRRGMKVHRLVGFVWVPLVVGKKFINHKDGNKANNHYSNLEWVTSSENLQHAYKTGLRATVPIAQYTLMRVFLSITQAAAATYCCISAVLNGRSHTEGGYLWSYLQTNGKPNHVYKSAVTKNPATKRNVPHKKIYVNWFTQLSDTVDGQIWSLRLGRYLNQSTNNGYSTVSLRDVTRVLAGKANTHANCLWEKL